MSASQQHAVHESASVEPWPQGFSREPALSIGTVAEQLKREFPAVTVSKIRFWEAEGLVTPARTSSGYRKYSEADVERLRFMLASQRDSFKPLRVIAQELAALDAGQPVEMPQPVRVVAADGKIVAPSNRPNISQREVMDLTGCDLESLERYVKLGLLRPNMQGYFPVRSIHVIMLLRRMEAEGIDARLLRSVQTAADRGADIVETAVAPTRSRGRSADNERAAAQASEMGELFADLYREMLRNALAALNS